MKDREPSKPVAFRLNRQKADLIRAVAWDMDLELGQAVVFMAEAYREYVQENYGGDLVQMYKNHRRAKERHRLAVEAEFRIKKKA